MMIIIIYPTRKHVKRAIKQTPNCKTRNEMRWYQDGSQGDSIWGCKVDGIGSWQGRRVGFGVSTVEGSESTGLHLKCDGTRAETRFRLSAKGTSPFKSAGGVVWRVLSTHSIRQFPLHFPSRASPCAITFQLDSTTMLKCTSPTNDAQHGIPCVGSHLRSTATTLKWIRPMTSTKRGTWAPSESNSCSFECAVSFWVHNISH
jgi:hypothetical protein